MIDVNSEFALFANCEVIYDGRAYSTLELGNYLIIHKQDGSIQIHASSKIPPRNYQGPGTILECKGNILTATNKKEIITIVIHSIISIQKLSYWSNSEIEITRTEAELADKLFYNWCDYIDGEFELIQREFLTKHGSIDLLGVDRDLVRHVVEVKRRKCSIKDCTQLKRYLEVFEDDGLQTCGYLASPEIGAKAVEYLEKHGCYWIQVEFDSSV